MAKLMPFKAVRPRTEKAARVAALPYDVVDRYEARAIGDANPDSFLHIDRAEIDLDPSADIYAPEVYAKARENLRTMIAEGVLNKDPVPCYYIYEQNRLGKIQTGIVGCASVDDYLTDVVKKHELTREEKELDRIRHVDVCDANTGPIFLVARYPEDLKNLVGTWKKTHQPVYDFVSEDGIGHRCWVIDEEKTIRSMRGIFDGIPSFYIADGHHRAASAVKVALKRRESHPDYAGTEEFNYFLSVVFPFDEMTILGYHRIVKDLNGLSREEFLRKIRRWYDVYPSGPDETLKERHTVRMYQGGSWYLLKALPASYEGKDEVGQLDVSILQELVLGPLLGIRDPRSDSRIRFAGGICREEDIVRLADETGGAAFVMFPTSIEELMAIADAGKRMPPKSTWFEPKLRSGLFIHQLS